MSLFISNAHATTKILVWGDSLSAAYGIPIEKGWVSLMQKSLGDDFKIINGSISGETTQGGLTRLPKALETHSPDLVILELGANDGLRGISPQVSKINLQQMILKSKQSQAKVMLLGMRIPLNYGPAYSKIFESQFAQLAKQYELPFIPFFLDRLVGDIDNFQSDQLHPTIEAQAIILETILPTVKSVFDEVTLDDSKANTSKNSTSNRQGDNKEEIKNPA